MVQRLLPDAELATAARRFRRILQNKKQVIIVTGKAPSADALMCAACLELNLNDLDSRLGIVRVQSDDHEWYKGHYEDAFIILIHARVSEHFLYLLTTKANVLVIDPRESVLHIVNEHNAKYHIHENIVVDLAKPARGHSAAYIGWSISNRYVGNSHSPVPVPVALVLVNERTAYPMDEELTRDLPTTFTDYLEAVYNGSLEQTRELLASSEEMLVKRSLAFAPTRNIKEQLAARVAKRALAPLFIKGYTARVLRLNIQQELMDSIGLNLLQPDVYLLTYELTGSLVQGRVYYGENWEGAMAKNPDVERLRINLQGEREDYGFSFSVFLRKRWFKSPLDVIAHSLIEHSPVIA